MLESSSRSNKENNFLKIPVQIILLYNLQPVCFWSIHINTRREVVSRQGRRHHEGQDFFFSCCSMNHSQGPRSNLSCSMTHGSLSAPSMNSSREIWPGTTTTKAKCVGEKQVMKNNLMPQQPRTIKSKCSEKLEHFLHCLDTPKHAGHWTSTQLWHQPKCSDPFQYWNINHLFSVPNTDIQESRCLWANNHLAYMCQEELQTLATSVYVRVKISLITKILMWLIHTNCVVTAMHF